MKITRSLFPSLILSLMFLCLLVFGIPISAFASEPHVCINNAISTAWQNINNNSQPTYTFTFAAGSVGTVCGHTSNTVLWKFDVYNYSTGAWLCGQDNSGVGYVPPPDPYDGSVANLQPPLPPVTCNSLPTGTAARIKVVVSYQVTGSTWMTHTDFLRNY